MGVTVAFKRIMPIFVTKTGRLLRRYKFISGIKSLPENWVISAPDPSLTAPLYSFSAGQYL